ncbi:MAG: M13 family peptidase, partial [Proteobacteria bacterium]|nr:M13 family peptidase [Pseudomonadota bacterium]
MPRPSLILAAAIACACAACSQQSPNASGSAAAVSAAPAATVAQPAPASTAPDIGIDLAYIDKAVKPGDNFFEYTNGDWLKTAEIPADRSSIGAFYDIFKVTEQHTADLIKGAGADNPAAGSNARKIADFYAAYMDTTAIDKAGLAPLQPEFDAINAIKTRTDLARVLGSRLRADVDPINATHFHTQHLFGLFVTKGLEEESTQIAYLMQGGVAMPSRDYYLSKDPHMVEARNAYKTYVTALLKQAGIAGADKKAEVVIALETRLAAAQESLVESEDIHKANTLWAASEFVKKAPGLDWNEYFKAAGLEGV